MQLSNMPIWVDSFERGILWSALQLYGGQPDDEEVPIKMEFKEIPFKDKINFSLLISASFRYQYRGKYIREGLNFINSMYQISEAEVDNDFELPNRETIVKNLPEIPYYIFTIEQLFVWLCMKLRRYLLKRNPPDNKTIVITNDNLGLLTVQIYLPYFQRRYFNTRNLFSSLRQFLLESAEDADDIDDVIPVVIGGDLIMGNNSIIGNNFFVGN